MSNSLAVPEHHEAGGAGFFSQRPLLLSLTLAVLFLASFCIRVYRITDPPLDFHPVRQYFGALTARSRYYSHVAPSAPEWMATLAAAQNPGTYLEPRILESVAIALYPLSAGERLWIPRLLSSFFWLLGGAPLYLLVKRTVSSDAAVTSTAFYLLLPYAVFASRAFMPNPLMVMMMLFAILFIFRYGEAPTMPRAAIAGVVTALAILIQPFPVFLTLGAFASLAVQRQGLRKSLLDPLSWMFSVAAVLPAALYYCTGILVAREDTSVLSFHIQPQYLLDLLSYRYWLAHVQTVIGFGPLTLALVGVLMFRRGVARAVAAGLWFGYVVYGLVFVYHMRTHDYYQLVLIPLVAMCLGPVGGLVLARLHEAATTWPTRALTWSVLAVALILALGVAGTELSRRDFDDEVRIYEEVGEAVNHSTQTIFLTEHYGFALEYHGWLAGKAWPSAAYARAYGLPGLSPMSAEDRFLAEYAGNCPDYFIVTKLEELEEQPDLRVFLTENFSIMVQTEDYVIFDLKNPSPACG